MLKQQAQMMTVEQLAQELREVRSEYEGLRRQTKTLGARTSQLYLQLDRLKQTSKENGR